MFDSKQTLTKRLSDAVDLAIDFATLGEYGLEPIEAPSNPCEARRAHLNELYALRTPRTAPSTPTCDSRMQANPFSGRRNANTATRGPRQGLARKRGVRGASGTFAARGAA